MSAPPFGLSSSCSALYLYENELVIKRMNFILLNCFSLLPSYHFLLMKLELFMFVIIDVAFLDMYGLFESITSIYSLMSNFFVRKSE